MSNMTRYDPFSMEGVPDLFQGLFRPLRGVIGGEEGQQAVSIRLDVTESDSAYTVKAELPGVDRKDIDVKIDGGQVSIAAKIERDAELKEGERVIRRERYAGSVSRSFTLATDIDDAAASAQYQDGVLTLTLPKKAAASSRRLEIG
ncbi:Hsp20/alpha crystallin family protein [Paraburkholderia caballeronis]|uniref:Heat shock protein Hsp20 n=1 Tax=Paraburkholderia caballeronis TaxID=416943 RepID=A0A1H7SBP2_9BURK|nr:Hsp20/alpha crystallin family protein [Paraburkholderia caballeronis]PXW22966.1 heat shock protein Hsp20 [Paraburkholderia caballeronis]PXW97351.1 heat shock protein Hsp20 [Paraburkholderia caballeronis]RAJ93871.1 heat shock protein Hsp20 [Paraburkholderia caballeronis]SED54341.1 heat shock protein Hsp20 [Paraburkholderia caballeronis]SEL69164.1 heat shock protein Hsp20 [Paraburkholderia caballeronis]